MSSSEAKKHRMEIGGDGFCAKMPLTRRLALAALIIVDLRGQQRGPFTAQQSAAGSTAYQAHCASCHLANLAGRNEAPPLAGSNFMNTWGVRSTRELFTYIQTTMPPGTAGTNHNQECSGSTARVGVGHERRRRESANAYRSQRHHLSRQHQQHSTGARRPHWRIDLGEPHWT